MSRYVADKMAIVLYLEKRKLPQKVKELFRQAEEKTAVIYISSVSLMEIGYLSEKLRISTKISSVTDLTKKNQNFAIYPLDAGTITEAFKIKTIPELHDRLITASAFVLNADLITNDPVIIKSQYVNTIWQ